MSKVFVLGRGERSFLATIRSLGRAGVAVHVGWHVPGELALRSRHVTAIHALPLPGHDGWQEALARVLARERFDLVLPARGEPGRALLGACAALSGYGRLYAPVLPAPAVTAAEAPRASLDLLVRDGEPLLAFQYERAHDGSSHLRSVPLDAALLEAARELLRPAAHTGFAALELARVPSDGRWALVRAEPWFGESLALALAAGADFPLGLFQLLTQGRVQVRNRYRAHLHCRYLSGDLRVLRTSLASEAPRALARALSGRERSDTLVLDDPLPGLAEIGRLAARVADEARAIPRSRFLALPFVRRRLQRAAERALASAHGVLFVCKGNICRSPFAALFAQDLGSAKSLGSAGTYETNGRSSPETAIEVARERFGLDLTPHRSRTVNAAMMQEADAVFVFDLENLDLLRARFPERARRIHLLGALSLDGPLVIEDPYAGSPARFEGIYRRIADVLGAQRRHFSARGA